MNRVESEGSLWLLDDEQGRYCRMPKQEGPRWSPPEKDWGGETAGPLQDLKWHPMSGWEIRPVFDGTRLVIYLDDEREHCITAPIPREAGSANG